MTLYPHAARLERWLGAEAIARVSDAMRGWYGPPIALSGVPGGVLATGDGDFIGECRAGWEMSARDRLADVLRRMRRGFSAALSPRGLALVHGSGGFASLAELIAAGTVKGRRQKLSFYKSSLTMTAGNNASLWMDAGVPTSGAAISAAPGGDVPTAATQGALPFINPISGEYAYFLGMQASNVTGMNSLLLYDRLFQVAKTMSSTGTEAVTGVPTRYQNTTAGTVDSAEGNFVFPEVSSTLGATAHNWTVCQYTAQGGATGHSFQSVSGVSSQWTNAIDLAPNQWFVPLAAGDTGVKSLTQMQCSASVTGTLAFVIGHPIAWLPCPAAALVAETDSILSGVNLARIFDNAALAFLEIGHPSVTGGNWHGVVTIVSN